MVYGSAENSGYAMRLCFYFRFDSPYRLKVRDETSYFINMRMRRIVLMVYYRRNLLVLSLTTFLITCCWNQVAPFLPLFIKELGVKSGLSFWAGLLQAAQMATAIVMTPYWGKLADKYGRKLMIIRAEIGLILIFLGMSCCRTLWQLLVMMMIIGMLVGFIPMAITLVAINTPKSEAPRFVAVLQSIVAFGVIAGPIVGSILTNWVGYRGSMRISAIVVAIAVLLVFLLVEERQKVSDNNQPTSLKQDLGLVFQKPVLVIALCSDMTYGLVMKASYPLLILYIQELIGIRANLFIGPVFSLPALAVLMTNYLWCRLGERWTFQRVILLGLAGTGTFTLLQGLVRNIWWFAAAYFLAGLCAAAVSPNTAGLVVTNVEADFQGRAFAIQESSKNFGGFLAPLLAGFFGSILPLKWVFIIVGLLGLAMMLLIWLQICVCQQNKTAPNSAGS
jgi:DHA1 family multidrug resistance protein-like MFS transporter